MDERNACALLKQRFEAAGYRIAENRPFEEQGIAFEIDGFDPDARVGYEYISSEAGDSWDVGDEVVAAMEARRKKGEIHILFVDEANAAELGERADAFLAGLKKPKKTGGAKQESAAKPVAAKPGAKVAGAKPSAKDPAMKESAAKKESVPTKAATEKPAPRKKTATKAPTDEKPTEPAKKKSAKKA